MSDARADFEALTAVEVRQVAFRCSDCGCQMDEHDKFYFGKTCSSCALGETWDPKDDEETLFEGDVLR